MRDASLERLVAIAEAHGYGQAPEVVDVRDRLERVQAGEQVCARCGGRGWAMRWQWPGHHFATVCLGCVMDLTVLRAAAGSANIWTRRDARARYAFTWEASQRGA